MHLSSKKFHWVGGFGLKFLVHDDLSNKVLACDSIKLVYMSTLDVLFTPSLDLKQRIKLYLINVCLSLLGQFILIYVFFIRDNLLC